MRIVVLFGLLFGFWLALSGHYTPFLIASGAAICAFAALATRRMGTDDDEALPIAFFPRVPTYYPWLIVEIFKSAWTVARIILSPVLPISPVLTEVRGGQKSTTGIATFANSITLTPGTVATHVRGKTITVYALTRAGADDIEAGGMNNRVKRFEGRA